MKRITKIPALIICVIILSNSSAFSQKPDEKKSINNMSVEITLNYEANGINVENLSQRQDDERRKMAEHVFSYLNNTPVLFMDGHLKNAIDEIKITQGVSSVCDRVNRELLDNRNDKEILLDSPIFFNDSSFDLENDKINIL